jgi:hypothetical protein
MNAIRFQASRQLRAGLSSTIQRPASSAFKRAQSRHYAEKEVRYQKGDKTAPWPLWDSGLTLQRIIGGGVIVVMAARYFPYSDKKPASEHQHSRKSGVGPAGAEDHQDKYRDKRDTPNKGTR